MQFRNTIAVFLFVVCGANRHHVAPVTAAEKPTRFMAVMMDGVVVQNDSLIEWHTVTGQPKLDGKSLLDPKNPFLWLRDRGLPAPSVPRAYVETITGDRLPGTVIGYRDGLDRPYSPAPASFVVRPETPLQPPQIVADPKIHVVASHVRRLVWQRRENDQFQPNTLFYRDGRSVSFRSIRFGDGLVTLLLAADQRKVFFTEIAEIHLPPHDSWNSYLDELATLCPRGEGRLLQLETTDGLIATTSLERFATSGSANPNDFTRWIHGIQPVWSLEILWVPTGNVALRRSFAPHEVPLTRLWPVSSEQRSMLAGVGPPWRLNRNVQLGPLRNSRREFGWGFGVHAFSELQFELPPLATVFRGAVGLDRIAGNGGCVRARIFADDVKSKPLFESPPIVGSEKIETINNLPIAGRQRLILQVDPAHDDRPAGADPLDIRDLTNWLEPVIELDAAKLKQEIEARLPNLVPALAGWNLVVDRSGPEEQRGAIEWFNVRDENSPAPGTFRLGILAKKKPLVLEREQSVGADSRWLSLLPFQPVNTGQTTKLEVRLQGEPIYESPIPVFPRGVAEPPALTIPLRDYEGHALKFQVLQFPPPAPVPIVWRFAKLADQLPTLFQAFEDRGDLQQIGETEIATALQATDRASGERAIRLTTGQQLKIQLPRTISIREIPQLGEFRHIRFSVRKSKLGLFALEYQEASGRDKPLRHDGGVGNPAFGGAVRVWADPNSEMWIPIMRDLYIDFGKSEITAITLSCVAGESAAFDGIYFGRSGEDFLQIPKVVPFAKVTEQQQKEIVQPGLDRSLPAVVNLKFADGRCGTGILVDKDGGILTAGHLLIGPKRPVSITLAEGEVRTGQTLGIAREFDVGLIRMEKPHYRYCVLAPPSTYSERLLHIAAAHTNGAKPAATPISPIAQVVEMRRLFRNKIWTDFDLPNVAAGGPLVDQYARTVAVHIRRDPVGGFVYQRLGDVAPLLPRMGNGEVFGTWPIGCEPDPGWRINWDNGQPTIDQFATSSPAEKAGLRIDDVVTKLNDRAITTAADLALAIAEKNPEDEVTVEVQRSGKNETAKIKLAPRLP